MYGTYLYMYVHVCIILETINTLSEIEIICGMYTLGVYIGNSGNCRKLRKFAEMEEIERKTSNK